MISFLFACSAKPQEYKERLEKRHEGKKDVLGHSKQAEFVRVMEQEVAFQLSPFCYSQKKDKLLIFLCPSFFSLRKEIRWLLVMEHLELLPRTR